MNHLSSPNLEKSFFSKYSRELALGIFILIGSLSYLNDKAEEKCLFFPENSILQDEIAFFSPLEINELMNLTRTAWKDYRELTVFVAFDRIPQKLRPRWSSQEGHRIKKARSAYAQIQKNWKMKHQRNVNFYCIERDTEENVFRFYRAKHHYYQKTKHSEWRVSVDTPFLISKKQIYPLISKEIVQVLKTLELTKAQLAKELAFKKTHGMPMVVIGGSLLILVFLIVTLVLWFI